MTAAVTSPDGLPAIEGWRRAHPRPTGPWTLVGDGSWAALEPESGTVIPVRPGADRKLPALAGAAGRGRLVSYRIGRRAVVDGPDGFWKVVRPSRLASLVAVHDLLGSGRCGMRIPEVGGVDGDGAVLLDAVDGPSLHQLLRGATPGAGDDEAGDDGAGDDTGGLSAALAAVGTALARFHATPAPDSLPLRTPDHPDRWVTTVARAEPAAVPELAVIAAALPPLPPSGGHLGHGDLHDKNVLLTPDGPALIDLDGAGRGRAEDDVANLSVHLELRALQAGADPTTGRERAARFLDAYLAASATGGGEGFRADRFDAASRHTWFRLACLYRFRPAGRPLVPDLLARSGR